MNKKLACVLLAIGLVFTGMQAAAASSEGIMVTPDKQTTSGDIVVEQATVNIPITAKDLKDVYAFTLNLQYSPAKIKIESITPGDIFKNFGSAVVKNSIDNTAGQAAFMQTILSAKKGTDGNGVLCNLTVTLSQGEYDIAKDLGLQVKIANSVPEYMDAYVAAGKIIYGQPKTGSQNGASAATGASAQGTASTSAAIGIITPAPNSTESFKPAESQSIEEIQNQVDKQNTVNPSSNPDQTQSLKTNGGSVGIYSQNSQTNLILLIVAIVAAVGLVLLIIYIRKIKNVR